MFNVNMLVVWLVLAVAFVVVEAASTMLVSIWFVFGSLAAAILAGLGAPVYAQFIAFVAVSVLVILTLRPLAKDFFNRTRVNTNADSNVGRVGLVTGDIDNLQGTGQVTIEGMPWSAKSTVNEVKIAAGETVVVRAIDGVKLVVEKAQPQ